MGGGGSPLEEPGAGLEVGVQADHLDHPATKGWYEGGGLGGTAARGLAHGAVYGMGRPGGG